MVKYPQVSYLRALLTHSSNFPWRTFFLSTLLFLFSILSLNVVLNLSQTPAQMHKSLLSFSKPFLFHNLYQGYRINSLGKSCFEVV